VNIIFPDILVQFTQESDKIHTLRHSLAYKNDTSIGPILSMVSAVFMGAKLNKKLSYCWETVRRKSMPRIAEMDVEMTT